MAYVWLNMLLQIVDTLATVYTAIIIILHATYVCIQLGNIIGIVYLKQNR